MHTGDIKLHSENTLIITKMHTGDTKACLMYQEMRVKDSNITLKFKIRNYLILQIPKMVDNPFSMFPFIILHALNVNRIYNCLSISTKNLYLNIIDPL